MAEPRDKANLKRTTKQTIQKMMAAVKEAKKKVEALIAENVRQNPYGWMDAGRESTYAAIDAHFKNLRKRLDEVSRTLVWGAAIAGTVHAEAKSKGAVVGFSDEHLRAYLERVTPKNAPSIAAVYTASMSASVKAALRETAINVFTQGAAAGLTMNEQARQFQAEWALRIKDADPYRFVDKAGRKWENARYIQMLTRTTAQRVETAAFCDTMLSSGFPLARISNDTDHDCDVCAQWEGRLIDLSSGHQLGSGTYTLQEAREAGLFHPNCTHRLEYVSVLEIPDAIMAKVKDKIGVPNAFGTPGEAVKPDLPNKKQTQQHIKQVEKAAEEKVKAPIKTSVDIQKPLTKPTLINQAEKNRAEYMASVAKSSVARPENYKMWIALLTQRDCAWLKNTRIRKARDGAYEETVGGVVNVYVDGAKAGIVNEWSSKKSTFFHETGHAILDRISQLDQKVYQKISALLDKHRDKVVAQIEAYNGQPLKTNKRGVFYYEDFHGGKPWKAGNEKQRIFKKGRSAMRSDAACALTRGQKASGHRPSYWGSGSRNDYFSSHEFVANLTAARYTKDYQFMKMFSPVAQEVQALLDSYEP